MHTAGSGLSAVCITVQAFTFLVNPVGHIQNHISRGCLESQRGREKAHSNSRSNRTSWVLGIKLCKLIHSKPFDLVRSVCAMEVVNVNSSS